MKIREEAHKRYEQRMEELQEAIREATEAKRRAHLENLKKDMEKE